MQGRDSIICCLEKEIFPWSVSAFLLVGHYYDRAEIGHDSGKS